MTIYNKLAAVEAKMAVIEQILGLPQRRNLLLKYSTYNTLTKTLDVEYLLIDPIPHVSPVPAKYVNLQVAVEGADSLFITTNDIHVEIPRTLSKTTFNPEDNVTIRYFIDPPLTAEGEVVQPLSGYWYRLIYLDESDPTVWKLIITRERDRK